ncbi:MAG: c-type cytochrome domain-containing protein [Akkermansiaceae bacterium]
MARRSKSPRKSSSSPKDKIFLTVLALGVLAILGVAIMPTLGEVGMAGPKVTTPTGKWIAFLGEFHPLFLHLPIGALMLVLVMEFCGFFQKENSRTTLAVAFAAGTSIFAVVFGYFLYLTGEFPAGLVDEHKRDSIIFTILLIITFLVKFASDRFPGIKPLRPTYYAGLLLTIATLFAAAHHGGEITHGDPLDKAPWNSKDDKEKAVITDPEVYQHIVHPILEAKCISCHGEKKQKSGLRMDTYAGLIDGGEETDCLIPGDVKESAMISFLHLPEDDDQHMPPEGKTQLTEEEIQILTWWVKIDAPEKAKLSEVETTPEILTALNSLKTPEEIAAEKKAQADAEKARIAAMETKRKELAIALKEINGKFPGSLNYVSQQNSDLSFSSVSFRKKFNDESLKVLEAASADLTELDLSGSAISDKGLTLLEKCSNLRSLKLNQTKITDAALAAVSKVNTLEVLNLHSTAVTDAGLSNLHKLSALKRVYLWNSKVTPAAAKALEAELQKNNKDAKVIHGK